jgi:hypothetical protein
MAGAAGGLRLLRRCCRMTTLGRLKRRAAGRGAAFGFNLARASR